MDIVADNMDKYLTNIGIKTCEIADTTKVKLEMHSLKKKRDETLISIGKMVYKMCLKDKFDEKKIAEKCSIITELDEQIKGKEYELDEICEFAKRAYKKTRKHGGRRREWEKGREKEAKDDEYERMESVEPE